MSLKVTGRQQPFFSTTLHRSTPPHTGTWDYARFLMVDVHGSAAEIIFCFGQTQIFVSPQSRSGLGWVLFLVEQNQDGSWREKDFLAFLSWYFSQVTPMSDRDFGRYNCTARNNIGVRYQEFILAQAGESTTVQNPTDDFHSNVREKVLLLSSQRPRAFRDCNPLLRS